MYPSDFIHAAPEPAVAPTLLAALIALAAVLAVAAFFAGRAVQRRAEAEAFASVAARIHRHIAKAAGLAAKASRDEVEPAARRLSETIAACLGPVLILARGTQGPVRALDRALAGEALDTPAEVPGAPDASPSGGIQVAVYKPETVIVGDNANAAPQRPAEPSPPAPTARALTRVEQIAAIRAAVDAIADHWADRPARIAEIRAAQRQLIAGAPAARAPRLSGS